METTMYIQTYFRRTEGGDWEPLNSGCSFANLGGWDSPANYVKDRKNSFGCIGEYLNGLEFAGYADTLKRVWFA